MTSRRAQLQEDTYFRVLRMLQADPALLGKPGVAQRLCGSLQVDISKTRELLGWMPSLSLDEGLRRAAGHGLPRFARNDGRLE
jgi:nucleoside-diphosphate-sugar epimerase